MALHSDDEERPDLIDELRRFGLLGDSRPRDNAPQMPVPEIDRAQGGVLPQMPMAAPPGGFNPMQMGGGGGGPTMFGNYLQSQGTKLWGGFDPQSGINWNTGRQGQSGSALGK